MNLRTVIVKWTGPHSFAEVCESEAGNGIYLLVGKRKYERTSQILYCGITEGVFCSRINSKHHKLGQIREDTLSIWLGEIIYPKAFKRTHLELAESCFVYQWCPPLNERKKTYSPKMPICFISQWFSKDGEPRLTRPSIVTGLPDLLWWDLERWRTGKISVFQMEE